LQQLGLIKAEGLPIAGAETAKKMVDPFNFPSNQLLNKWTETRKRSQALESLPQSNI
jgi:carboxymethylenebutenolidase